MIVGSSFDALGGLAELVIDTIKHVLVVDVELRRLPHQLLLDPILVAYDLLAIEVANLGINAAHLRAFVKLHGEANDLANVAFCFGLGLLGDPGGSLHELFLLEGLRGEDVLSAAQASIKLGVLLDQHTTLPLNLIIREAGLHLEGSVVILSPNRRRNA